MVVETADPVTGWAYARILSEAGFDVTSCNGPYGRGGSCPALEGRRCPWVDEADALLFAFGPLDAVGHRILDAHRRRPGGRPRVCLDAGPLVREALGSLAEGTEAVDARSTRAEIVAAVRRACA